MAVRLIDTGSMRGNEYKEVTDLLCSKGIQFYETPRTNWGFNAQAIWLTDESKLDSAKKILSKYYGENYNFNNNKSTKNYKIRLFLLTFIIAVIVSVAVIFW